MSFYQSENLKTLGFVGIAGAVFFALVAFVNWWSGGEEAKLFLILGFIFLIIGLGLYFWGVSISSFPLENMKANFKNVKREIGVHLLGYRKQ